MKEFVTDIKTVSRFLKATGGNWRSAVYIGCQSCRYPRREECGDYLCAFDGNAQPVMIPVRDCSELFRGYIDPSECILWISQYRFLEIYRNVFPREKDDRSCPFMNLQNRNT